MYQSAKFTATAVFSPIPAGYCITKENFSKSIDQTKSILATVQQCVKNQVNKFGKKNDSVTSSEAPVSEDVEVSSTSASVDEEEESYTTSAPVA